MFHISDQLTAVRISSMGQVFKHPFPDCICLCKRHLTGFYAFGYCFQAIFHFFFLWVFYTDMYRAVMIKSVPPPNVNPRDMGA